MFAEHAIRSKLFLDSFEGVGNQKKSAVKRFDVNVFYTRLSLFSCGASNPPKFIF